MLNSTLENIQKRQSYLQEFNQQKISTLQTKQAFCKAQQDFSDISLQNLSFSEKQKIIFCPKQVNPIDNLFKRILPAPQNSYEEIQQIQMQIKLLNSQPLNQIQVLKSVFNQQKDQIKKSDLKVNDFIDIYESLLKQENEKDNNDDLVRSIKKIFDEKGKNLSVYQLLQVIIKGVSDKSGDGRDDRFYMKEMRKKICQIQGIEIEGSQETQFREQTKKDMQRTLELFGQLFSIFDLQHLQ